METRSALRTYTFQEALANLQPEWRSQRAAIKEMLADKWKYAARKYRETHPGELPESKSVWTGNGWHNSSRLLPVELAETQAEWQKLFNSYQSRHRCVALQR